MFYVVTGAAGFIGSNIVKALNQRGHTNILAVDNLSQADKFKNLVDSEISDYLDKTVFRDYLAQGELDGQISAIFHQGACSDTMETDGRYMMDNNYRYSMQLLEHCQTEDIPFLYASSASVYGSGSVFKEVREHESPLNIYGYSKFLFDQYVRQCLVERHSQIVGFRYFNVYGPHESHKGRMASVASQFFNQYTTQGYVQLFSGSGGYADGMQRRDFVSVEDVVKVNLYLLDHPEISGIFNLGTGAAESFNAVALATINACRQAGGAPALSLAELQDKQFIRYIPFPQVLVGKYQSYTQADIGALRAAGYQEQFLDVATGVTRYVQHLLSTSERRQT